jgi:hypothetical protein
MKITIEADLYNRWMTGGENYTVDLSRPFGGYQPGDLICRCTPWIDMPLWLEIAIRVDGSIVFRSWHFRKGNNTYLHTYEKTEDDPGRCPITPAFHPTPEQCDTVAGLWSGRIRYEGLKLGVGASVQKICPIDVEEEEQKLGRTIYLS